MAQKSVDALVYEALAHNNELAFYEAEIAAARGQQRSSVAWPNPQFSTELGQKSINGQDGVAFAASITQTFEWPGRVSLRKAIADKNLELAQVGLEQFRATLAARVRQKAVELLGVQKIAQATRATAERHQELVGLLARREPAGIGPLLEKRSAEALSLKLSHQALEAERKTDQTLMELNALRGRPLTEPLLISEPPVSLPGMPATAELVRRTAQGNLQLRQRQIELSQQGFKVRLAKKDAWPSVTLGPQFSRETAGSETEKIAGVTLSLPLPLWNQNAGEIQTAQARLEQAQSSLALLERDLEQKLRSNALAYDRLRAELAKLKPETLQEMKEAALSADSNYRRGAISLTAYIDAQESYLEALEAITSMQAEALRARAEIEQLTGTAP